jgi:hypothetical protein
MKLKLVSTLVISKSRQSKQSAILCFHIAGCLLGLLYYHEEGSSMCLQNELNSYQTTKRHIAENAVPHDANVTNT